MPQLQMYSRHSIGSCLLRCRRQAVDPTGHMRSSARLKRFLHIDKLNEPIVQYSEIGKQSTLTVLLPTRSQAIECSTCVNYTARCICGKVNVVLLAQHAPAMSGVASSSSKKRSRASKGTSAKHCASRSHAFAARSLHLSSLYSVCIKEYFGSAFLMTLSLTIRYSTLSS
jgi:hypothetical protein